MKKIFESNLSQKIQQQIQSLLENSDLKNLQEHSNTQEPFQVSTDLSQLDSLSIGLPEELFKKASILFSRMSVYFESGLLLCRQNHTWRSQSAFKLGQYYPILPDEKKIDIHIPPISLEQIQKLNADSFLNKLHMLELKTTNEVTGLVIKPHPDFVFVLFSNLPDVWLRQQIESIHHKLLMILADN